MGSVTGLQFAGRVSCLQIFNRPVAADEIMELEFCDSVHPYLRQLPEIELERIEHENDTNVYVDYRLACRFEAIGDAIAEEVAYGVDWIVDGLVVLSHDTVLEENLNETTVTQYLNSSILDRVYTIQQVRHFEFFIFCVTVVSHYYARVK